jgi:hypothetical protein
MATTTNFGWTTPDDTDLVKDGASAIRTLGSAIDTSLVDLKGGTTGQVLAKASDTDMDFTWATDASGIPATIFDAKGDLIAASAADTAARLAVGANGTILTADSSEATGLKWVAPAAAAVSGVSLYKASQSMSSGSNTNFTGFTEDYDSNSFYSTGTDITIPTAGKYLIQYSVNFAPNSTGYRTLGINKNASTLLENDFGNTTAQSFNRSVGVIIRSFTFAVNDVLKFYTYQDSGVSLDARAFVTITYLGA